MVELKRVWFPILVAAFWVLMVAATLTNFASFSHSAARADAPVAGANAPTVVIQVG